MRDDRDVLISERFENIGEDLMMTFALDRMLRASYIQASLLCANSRSLTFGFDFESGKREQRILQAGGSTV